MKLRAVIVFSRSPSFAPGHKYHCMAIMRSPFCGAEGYDPDLPFLCATASAGTWADVTRKVRFLFVAQARGTFLVVPDNLVEEVEI